MTYLALEAGLSDRWPLIEFRRLATIRRETNWESKEELLALSAHAGVRRRAADGGNQLPSEETITKYWVANPGDLVFNPMWALEGGVAVSEIRGALSTAYRVYKLGPKLFPKFVHYFLRSTVAIDQYNLLVRGVTTFDRAVKREDFEPMPIPVPPLETQRRIADYLDQETKRIDNLVLAKERLLTLLDLRMQRVLDDAFSGFDRSLYRRLKFVTKLNCESWGEDTDPDQVLSYLDISAVGTGVLRSNPEVLHFSSAPSRARRIGRAGEVAISTVRTYLRSVWTISEAHDGVTLSTGFAVLRPSLEVDSSFLGFACMRSTFVDEVVARSVGISYPAINAHDLVSLDVPLPARDVQIRLVSSLNKETRQTELMTKQLRISIAKLHERRQALITAAVTGQLEI